MNIEEQQEQVQKRENESDENNNAYSLFLYGIRSPVTRTIISGGYVSSSIILNYFQTKQWRKDVKFLLSHQLAIGKVRVKDYLRLRVYQCPDISLQHPN